MRVTNDTEYRQMFENGRGMFFWTRLDDVGIMRGADIEFGILPIPKYTEEQDRYYSLVSIHTNGLMSVPITVMNVERTSAIMEAMAYESTDTVQVAYYDITLKGKSARDIESSDMLDIIIGNRVFDLGIFYHIGGFDTEYEKLSTNRKGMASTFATYEKRIEKDIDNLVKLISEMDNQ